MGVEVQNKEHVLLDVEAVAVDEAEDADEMVHNVHEIVVAVVVEAMVEVDVDDIH